jgi:hypothetical protein
VGASRRGFHVFHHLCEAGGDGIGADGAVRHARGAERRHGRLGEGVAAGQLHRLVLQQRGQRALGGEHTRPEATGRTFV